MHQHFSPFPDLPTLVLWQLNKSLSYNKTQRKYKRILLSERRQLKMATYLYDSNYINIQEKTKLQRQCKDQWLPGACEEEE